MEQVRKPKPMIPRMRSKPRDQISLGIGVQNSLSSSVWDTQ